MHWVHTGMFSQLKRSLTDLRGLHKSASAATMSQRQHQQDGKSGRWLTFSLCATRWQHCHSYNMWQTLQLMWFIIFWSSLEVSVWEED
jgi:hypothetical protein